MHCKGTDPNNGRSHEHCRDQAFGDFYSEVFHKMARLQAMRITVKDKNKTIIFAHLGGVSQRWIGFSEDDAKT
jgi:hypothetical protein